MAAVHFLIILKFLSRISQVNYRPPLTLFVIHGRGDQPLMGTPQQWLLIFIMPLVTLSFWGSHWGKKRKNFQELLGKRSISRVAGMNQVMIAIST